MTLDKSQTASNNSLSWFFAIVFFIIGILNLIHIHYVPGVIYIVLAILYIPYTNVLLKNYLHFSFPFLLKIILFVLIMWFTLGVGDLAEFYGL